MVDKRSPGESMPPEGGPEQQPSSGALGRRSFLKYAGLTLAGFVIPDWVAACGPSAPAGNAVQRLSVDLPIGPDDWKVVVRAQDLLRLRFAFPGLSTAADGGTTVLQ